MKKKVWILMEHEYESSYILKVFDSKEKVEKFLISILGFDPIFDFNTNYDNIIGHHYKKTSWYDIYECKIE